MTTPSETVETAVRTPRDEAIEEQGARTRLAELKEYWGGKGNVPQRVLDEMDALDRRFNPEKYLRGLKLDAPTIAPSDSSAPTTSEEITEVE